MNSKNQLFQFEAFQNEDIRRRYSKRDGELKLGGQILTSQNAKYVILGIEECIGPLANKGRTGAQNGFEPFLNKFLNMQSNETLVGDNIRVLGKITTKLSETLTDKYNETVEELDEFVFQLLSNFVKANQIPIVIGGGHNNAYPIIKFANSTKSSKIDVINLDAHADYRPLEGRHSGNPFSYAFRDEFIRKYTVLGLHQRYNSQRIIDDLKKDNHDFSFFEDYIDGKTDLKSDIENFVIANLQNKVGIELDLDSVEKMPSSAYSPSGISMDMARFYIRKMAELNEVAYLHLPEGAPLTNSEKLIVGKSLAYLVTDFISCHGDLKL